MLLTANVSFLAIQSIDTDHMPGFRSVPQIMSYASILLSLANYMLCQVLLRQHRKVSREDSDCAVRMPYLLLMPFTDICLAACRPLILCANKNRS